MYALKFLKVCTYRYTFSTNHNIHKSLCGLCFLAPVPFTVDLTKMWGNSVWVGRGLNSSYEKFEPFLYFKKTLETMTNFWPIGAGSLKLGRLAGFLQGF